MTNQNILVTGALGQIGTELIETLQQRYGVEAVIALDINTKPKDYQSPFYQNSVTDSAEIEAIIQRHNIGTIYHLASLLSATGEKNPQLSWETNVNGLKTILDLCVKHKIKLFWPSSIAVFGPSTPKKLVPQQTILEPTTMYGVTKLAGEQLCHYYHLKYQLDVRSLRYPGLISWKSAPGGGTTDYAVAIFHDTLKNNAYTSYLEPDTYLPMMYMDDAIRATLELIEANEDNLTVRTSYNITSMTFSPSELAAAITKHHPLTISYQADFRQQIAESWPESIDDSVAREDWGWKPKFNLELTVSEMLTSLQKQNKNDQ